jgi:hypothetical protein
MTRTKVEEMRNLGHNTIILALMALPTIYIVRILRDKLEMQLGKKQSREIIILFELIVPDFKSDIIVSFQCSLNQIFYLLYLIFEIL